ncbi:MAG: hypothetical protein LBR08_04965 [Bacteroidales bacterium]|jgi:glycerophosphoryl diester phosphodiesterase|nr:hypothetical protein [Bacteroidales bacterium]
MKQLVFLLGFAAFAGCCGNGGDLSPEARKVQQYMPAHAVVAHRGTVYWAPELTEAAFRWARNTGADYLELDVRYSKDTVLVIMHDATFNRTTDAALKFAGREKDPVESFTFEEIMQLSAGTKFNEKNPDRARESFAGQEVLTMEDVFRIAEGKRIKRDAEGKRIFHRSQTGEYFFEYEDDPADNGNRPGVYIETKAPETYPRLERRIYELLTRIGWNIAEDNATSEKEPFHADGKVNVGNTRGKILLQTFSREGMTAFRQVFKGKVLCSFLTGGKNDFSTEASCDEIIAFAKSAGAQFIGSNLGNDGKDGMSPMFSQRLHDAGLKANVYSFDTDEQMEKYWNGGQPLTDGMITNRTDLTLDFYRAKGVRATGKIGETPEEILTMLGY